MQDRAGGMSDELIEAVYSDLRGIAARYLRRERHGHTLQPTALVHEAWMRLSVQDRAAWRDPSHFRATAAMVMRRVLVDHALRRRARRRGGGRPHVDLTVDMGAEDEHQFDVIAIHEALERLEQMDPRQARIVELRFFGGSTNEEISAWLDVAVRTVQREWRAARAWLFTEIEGDEPDDGAT